jgi:hypothetical protein
MKITARRNHNRNRGLGRLGRGLPLQELALLGAGVASGATIEFFADPQSGARRRALARDRTLGAIRRLARRSTRGTRVVSLYGAGWSRRLRHLREERKDFDDATLAQKVQSEVFRASDAPKGTVDVNVAKGVVQLRGEVERPELIDDLVHKVRKVQGVREVESFLHLPYTPAPSQVERG